MKPKRPSFGGLVLRGLTPMLDTLFILLFALLALSDARQTAQSEEVRIELPAVEPGGDSAQAPAQLFSIFVDAASDVRFVGSDAGEVHIESFEDLDAALAERLGGALPEDVAIDIVADANARHGVTVELLQHLRLRGFVRVQLLATASEDGGTFGRAAGTEVDER